MKITRGDTYRFKFQRKDGSGEAILSKANKLYFTVKEDYESEDALIQKTIDDMDFDDETGYYSFTLEPNDTDNLKYGDYVYDIEVKQNDYTKTIIKGNFIIREEVTFAGNEV